MCFIRVAKEKVYYIRVASPLVPSAMAFGQIDVPHGEYHMGLANAMWPQGNKPEETFQNWRKCLIYFFPADQNDIWEQRQPKYEAMFWLNTINDNKNSQECKIHDIVAICLILLIQAP